MDNIEDQYEYCFRPTEIKVIMGKSASLDLTCRKVMEFCAKKQVDVILETPDAIYEIKYADVFNALKVILDKSAI